MVTAIPWPGDRVIPRDDWRPPAGTRVISADDHIQEPEHLWEERLPAEYRDRAPKLWKDEFGGYHLEIDGRAGNSPGIQKLLPLVDSREGLADLEQRLRDMDAEGIDVGMLFSQKTMPLLGMQDKELMLHCIDIYNEWLAGIQAQARGRLVGISVLPTIYMPEQTADYIQKLKHWGFKAMQVPSAPSQVEYNRSRMEPFWDAVEASGIPLSFHVRGMPTGGAGALGSDMTTSLQPFRRLWSLLTFSGILERHPTLKVVFTEGGASWAASAIYDADKVYRQYGWEMTPKLAQPPSYYWQRQCYTTFMDDPSAIKLVDDIGVEHILWSTDYPHPEGVLGEARSVMRKIFEVAGEEKAKQIVGGNAARVWGI